MKLSSRKQLLKEAEEELNRIREGGSTYIAASKKSVESDVTNIRYELDRMSNFLSDSAKQIASSLSLIAFARLGRDRWNRRYNKDVADPNRMTEVEWLQIKEKVVSELDNIIGYLNDSVKKLTTNKSRIEGIG